MNYSDQDRESKNVEDRRPIFPAQSDDEVAQQCRNSWSRASYQAGSQAQRLRLGVSATQRVRTATLEVKTWVKYWDRLLSNLGTQKAVGDPSGLISGRTMEEKRKNLCAMGRVSAMKIYQFCRYCRSTSTRAACQEYLKALDKLASRVEQGCT